MKFDIAIMNPPYSGNLHLKIIEKVIPHCKETINISPTTWLEKRNFKHPSGEFRNVLNGKVESIEKFTQKEMTEIFGGECFVESGAIIKLKEHSELDLISYGFENEIEKNLYSKIDPIHDDNMLSFRQAGICGEKLKVEKFYVPVYTWHGGDDCYSAVVKDKSKWKEKENVLKFSSKEEKDNFLESLKTTFMNWIYRFYVVPSGNKILNYMFVMKDYSQQWTDERFRDYFKITDEEWQLIEESMKKHS